MAWCQASDKPVPEAMMTKIYDASLRHINSLFPGAADVILNL